MLIKNSKLLQYKHDKPLFDYHGISSSSSSSSKPIFISNSSSSGSSDINIQSYSHCHAMPWLCVVIASSQDLLKQSRGLLTVSLQQRQANIKLKTELQCKQTRQDSNQLRSEHFRGGFQ